MGLFHVPFSAYYHVILEKIKFSVAVIRIGLSSPDFGNEYFITILYWHRYHYGFDVSEIDLCSRKND